MQWQNARADKGHLVVAFFSCRCLEVMLAQAATALGRTQ
jgi:hypothetical protein